MPTFAELGEAIKRDYQERAKNSPRVDIVAAIGKRLAAHVVTKEALFFFWEDGTHSCVFADYEDDWSELTPGDGWRGFLETDANRAELLAAQASIGKAKS